MKIGIAIFSKAKVYVMKCISLLLLWSNVKSKKERSSKMSPFFMSFPSAPIPAHLDPLLPYLPTFSPPPISLFISTCVVRRAQQGQRVCHREGPAVLGRDPGTPASQSTHSAGSGLPPPGAKSAHHWQSRVSPIRKIRAPAGRGVD